MTPQLISGYTATTCLGHGLDATLAALRAGRSGLQPCAFETVRLDTWIGEVAAVDARKLPKTLAAYDCRNNRLAELALRSDDFAGQVRQALHNVAAVLEAGGASPAHIVRMTWYVTDKHEYLSRGREVGAVFRELIGVYHAAMSAFAEHAEAAVAAGAAVGSASSTRVTSRARLTVQSSVRVGRLSMVTERRARSPATAPIASASTSRPSASVFSTSIVWPSMARTTSPGSHSAAGA